ncbi:Aerobic glycerol-3-phosphate dehydrogenase [bacterium HR29]|jgi:glycerol-3-phosphate dehydrogenase|nr:Aerobic glycerol-3-phosphate dehydrogenase [bacterium HR29]
MGRVGMTIEELASGPPLDLAIIGGGINGAGIFAEAARAGLRVALFEAEDFGFGTTWRSTKLIHGGLRYLEHGDVRLVVETLREREWLLRTRPHLVEPLRFLFPLLPWTRRPRWQIHLGLAAYDLLAWRRSLPGHQRLTAAALAERFPALADEQRGGFAFSDARCWAPERLALELVLEGVEAGGFAFNHTPVTGIITAGGRVTGIVVRSPGGGECALPARAVLNAAGPWADAVRELAGERGERPLLDLTRGTHIVVPAEGPLPRYALISTARSDGRVFFIIPQRDAYLVGTTDVRHQGDPGDVRPTPEEVEYLVAEAQALAPGLGVTRERVAYAYAGLRPLRRSGKGPEGDISRRHELVDHGRQGGVRGLYSATGGKLSTYRALGRELLERLGVRPAAEPAAPPAAPPAEAPHPRLLQYGGRLAAVLAAGREELCSRCGLLAGEVRHAVRTELAVTLSDVLLRRTGAAWSVHRAVECAPLAAAVMAEELGWDEGERERQLAAFRADLARHLPTPDEIAATLGAAAAQ